MAESAIEDEIRHARLCDEVAEEYGWDSSAHQHPIPEVPPFGPPGLSTEDRLLFEIVAFCCFTESINASMLVETLKITTTPRLKEVLREILRDEISHAKLGWAHLASMRQEGKGDFLSQTLPFIFHTAMVEEIFIPDPKRESEVLAEYGELNNQRRSDIFRAT